MQLFERLVMKVLLVISMLMVAQISLVKSEELKMIKLPEPQKSIGKPLMQVLNSRHTSRTFSSKPLELQEISNILWAANGINRIESGKRTAPSAMNNQETILYVFLQSGVYIYDAAHNSLEPVIGKDLREMTGKQDFVKTAPMNIVYVADFSRMGKAGNEDKILYSATDVGFIAENVYLYCASQDLSVVVRGSIDRNALSKILKLGSEQKIILSQTVGYPD